jgi:hypothetical protein
MKWPEAGMKGPILEFSMVLVEGLEVDCGQFKG